MYKVYLTEAGFKRYICLACGMKKSSSKERIISHLRSRHFHLISDSKFKCKSTILDNKDIQYSIQWNNKDYYENSDVPTRWVLAHPEIGVSVQLIQTRGADYITAYPKGSENLAASLENKEDKRIRVCPICFKMWPNWSRRDFSHHEIMCKLLELEYIHGMSERSRIVESLIQDLEGKFNEIKKSDYYLQ